MTREEVINEFKRQQALCLRENNWYKALRIAVDALEQEPCEDAISRQAMLDLAKKGVLISNGNHESVCKAINDLPSVNPQYPNTEQFAKWVATEIFDDNWEYNKDAFAEIACRKLTKLGIVKAKGDEWELIKSQEGSEKE